MSCPYLEKGKTAYCHAYGDKRLSVVSSGFEDSCFSGEFSECSFLFVPPSVPWGKKAGGRSSLSAALKTSWYCRNSTKGTPVG